MKFKRKKRLYQQGGVALHNQIPEMGVRAMAPIRNTKDIEKVSFLQKGNRMGTTAGKSNAEIMAEARRNQASGPAATSRPSNAEIMAEARRHQAREQGQQAQDAQAALAQQNRRNAIASNRIQGNVPSVPVASSFRIPTIQDMRAHANPVRRTGGIPFRNRAVAATNVLVPEGG